jgi:hypothetical protein
MYVKDKIEVKVGILGKSFSSNSVNNLGTNDE